MYLTRPVITTNDSSSWMVSWWTVVRLYQSYRLLQRRNALPVAPSTTYPLQTDNAFVPSVAEMRASSSSASLVPMTWLWLTWSIQSSAWTFFFKMEKANAASLIHVDAVSQIATRWKSFRWIIRPPRFFSLISATPVPNLCHCESRELSNANNMDYFEFLWTEFPEITEPNLSNVVTITVPLHIVTEGPPVYTPCRKLHGEKITQDTMSIMSKRFKICTHSNNCSVRVPT